MNARRLGFLLASCCLLGAASAQAGAPAPPRVETRLDRVALFKNGVGFFVREATLPASTQAVLIGPLAAPLHGTFWVSAPAAAGFRQVIAREVRIPGEPIDARDVGDLLRANVGRTVTVWISEGMAAVPITGTIIGFAPDRPIIFGRGPQYQMGPAAQLDERIIPIGRGEYVLIRSTDGVATINAYQVTRALFPTEPVATRFRVDEPGAELEVGLRTPRPGDRIGLTYLARGITWAPSYLIDITDPKTARLSAKALIVNEVEPLANTHVDLITGFPNVQFAGVTSPLALKTDLATFLQQLTGGAQQAEMGVITQRVAMAAGPAGPPGLPPVEYGGALAGQVAEDLFLYPVEGVTLAVGETGYYPLFTESAPYAELYEWTIPDFVSSTDDYIAPPPDRREVVWHSLRLTNTTRVPWTTAPAEVMQRGQFLGQDTLDYTAPGAQVTVKITQAVSITAEQNEVEADRQREALTLYGRPFDRVTIQGTLRATNRGREAVTLEVNKTVSGDVTATNPPAKVTTLAAGMARVNPVHKLTWTVAIAPGQTQEMTYTYQALIRR